MASHPPKAIDMVVAAIVGLKERDGASQEAILKYIGGNFTVNMAKVGPHIRRAIKTGTVGGKLISSKKGLYKVSPAVASASLMKQEKAKTNKKVAAKKTTVTGSKIVRPKPPTPKKAAAGKPKKKGPVSSKPKKKSKGGKKAGKKQTAGKKAGGKKGGKKK